MYLKLSLKHENLKELFQGWRLQLGLILKFHLQVALHVMNLHPGNVMLLDQGCYCLSNTAFNNSPNVKSIVEEGGVILIINALSYWAQNVDLHRSGITCISNVCSNNMPNKVNLSLFFLYIFCMHYISLYPYNWLSSKRLTTIFAGSCLFCRRCSNNSRYAS